MFCGLQNESSETVVCCCDNNESAHSFMIDPDLRANIYSNITRKLCLIVVVTWLICRWNAQRMRWQHRFDPCRPEERRERWFTTHAALYHLLLWVIGLYIVWEHFHHNIHMFFLQKLEHHCCFSMKSVSLYLWHGQLREKKSHFSPPILI